MPVIMVSQMRVSAKHYCNVYSWFTASYILYMLWCIYIYILIHDISKNLSLYKVYLLFPLNMEDTWYFLLILWKKITLGWYLQHYEGVLFSFSKDWNKILRSLPSIVCSIPSDYTISECILDTRMSMYAHKICSTC